MECDRLTTYYSLFGGIDLPCPNWSPMRRRLASGETGQRKTTKSKEEELMMRKVAIAVLAVAVVFGMSIGVMADDGHEATIEQDGTNLDAMIEQTGESHEATITQDGNLWGLDDGTHDPGWEAATFSWIDQAGSDNEAIINSSSGGGNSALFLRINQDGNENFAEINRNYDRHGANSWSEIDQMGDENEATIDSYLSAYPWSISSAVSIYQDGDENKADVFSGGDTKNLGGSDADLVQEGNKNTIELVQTEADAWVEQEGDENEFVGFNGDAKTDTAVQTDSVFTGQQTGNRNVIGLHQGGDDVASIDQVGNDNKALLYQGEEGSHDATIDQDGDDNEAEVIQN